MTVAEQEGPKRRGKGRPPRGASNVGREAVITAARRLLKKMPPSKITRVDLSREAGVDPAMIRYYFGNKSSLITEVMLQIFQDLQARRATPGSETAPFRERLRQRIAALLEVLQENPHLHEMLLRRAVFGEEAASDEIQSIRQEYTFNSFHALSALIADGVRNGECRPIQVEYLHIALIGLSEFAVSGFPLFELLIGQSGDQRQVFARYADFLADLLVQGLAPRDPENLVSRK
jgi:AcrR family transcriptional regulator